MKLLVVAKIIYCLCVTFCLSFDINKDTDYIVVGGGTAGSIVAARLVETGKNVVVIEAGKEPEPITDTQRFYSRFLKTDIDWQYQTEPQDHAFFGSNKISTLSAGKVFGGTGTINAMVFLRGSKDDYNSWVSQGATGWGWTDVLPYFKKIENATSLVDVDPKDHNYGGLIPITNTDDSGQPILKSFTEAIKREGYKETDPNDGNALGVGRMPFNWYDGERQSTYKKYLRPLVRNSQSNLVLLPTTIAKKIVFDSNNKAIGVEIIQTNTNVKTTLYARKEIILCAGAIETPKLLMLSGIGPKVDLENLGINVITDRPVGKNFHDHFAVYAPAFVKAGADETAFRVAFVKSDNDQDRSDIEYFNTLKGNYSIAGTILNRVESRGEVKLRSNDYRDKPRVNPNYFSNENDRKRLSRGFKKHIEILRKMDLKGTDYVNIIDKGFRFEELTACKSLEEEKKWECYLNYLGVVSFHPVGTARMGAENSNEAVVDPKLKVLGVSNLRVIDASVMPSTVSANTQLAVMMIAEKGSQLIKDDLSSEIE